MEGWIKAYRQLLGSVVFQNADLLKVWMWCLLKASHKEHTQLVGYIEQTLQPGEFIFGRKKAAVELNFSEPKTYRLLKRLESLQNVYIKPNNKYSVVGIVNWGLYQGNGVEDEQQNEQQMNNKRTTNEQQMNTNKNVKNDNNANNIKDIVAYLNNITGKSFKDNSTETKKHITARLKEGYQIDDFKSVVDKKFKQWTGTEMEQYLRPQTLFGNKFESYLNESETQPKPTAQQFKPNRTTKFHYSGATNRTSQYSATDLEEIARRKREESRRARDDSSIQVVD